MGGGAEVAATYKTEAPSNHWRSFWGKEAFPLL